MKKLAALVALTIFSRGFIKGVKDEMERHEKMTDDYVELTKKMEEEARKAEEENNK